MKSSNGWLWASALSSSLLFSCMGGEALRLDDGLAAEKIEMQVNEAGQATEIEYHVMPEVVPVAVKNAMERLHPGGRATGAEKEYGGSQLYWEMQKEIDGHAIEAMFHPDGKLHSEEVEIDASTVPDVVVRAQVARLEGEVTSWEEIRDGDRKLVEYHAKVSSGGRSYKMLILPDGKVRGLFREIVAEIELPVVE